MGEKSVAERILGSYICREAFFVKDDFTSMAHLFGYLHSFPADKLKYFHGEAFGYNACRYSLNLGGAWTVKHMEGEQ
jgi:hypothetical protein